MPNALDDVQQFCRHPSTCFLGFEGWLHVQITSPDGETTGKLFITRQCCKRPPLTLGGEVLPLMSYVGTCGPKGYGFSAVLVINRVLILAYFGHFVHK